MDTDTGKRIAAQSPRKANLYGASSTKSCGAVTHADTFGTDLACHSAPPPPLAEYDSYIRGGNARRYFSSHRNSKTAARLRRIVIMRRSGASWKDCGEAVGINASTAKKWVELLPMELAV